MATKGFSLAILDDYQSIASPYFTHIPGLPISSFPETLPDSRYNEDALFATIDRLQPFEIISCMRERTPFPASLLEKLPNLRLLLTTGMRNAAIDIEVATSLGILVVGTTGKGSTSRPLRKGIDNKSNIHGEENGRETTEPDKAIGIPPGGFDDTTQHTFALLLGLMGRIAALDRHLKGPPKPSARAEMTSTSLWQERFTVPLAGRTFGVLGLGRLGARAAGTAVFGFGMRVLAWSSSLTQEKADEQAEQYGLPKGAFEVVGKEELFRRADVVSLHYVLSERSRGMVGRKELGSMKKGAVLVNTSRGPLVDEAALLGCCLGGGIRGVALDVFWSEPLPNTSEWRTIDWGREGRSEVILSPHMGYVEEGNLKRWYEEQAENVERWIAGKDLSSKLG